MTNQAVPVSVDDALRERDQIFNHLNVQQQQAQGLANRLTFLDGYVTGQGGDFAAVAPPLPTDDQPPNLVELDRAARRRDARAKKKADEAAAAKKKAAAEKRAATRARNQAAKT